MKKLLILFLTLILALSLAACDFFTGGGNNSTGTSHPANSGQSTNDNGSTAQPTATGDDAVSKNALIGSWKYLQIPRGDLWIFGEDGSFVMVHVFQSITPGSSDKRWDYASVSIVKGKYRVNAYNIECYDCQYSGKSKLDENYFGPLISNQAALDLLFEPLSNPEKYDDFIVEFEFTNAMFLRIVNYFHEEEDYDLEFEYISGDSHNATIPTHIIPSREWPKNSMPPGLPEYNGGRKRHVEINNDVYNSVLGGNTTEALVYIDKTTSMALSNYIDYLLQAGWTADWGNIEEVVARESENIACSYKKDGHAVVIGCLGSPVDDGRFFIQSHYLQN